LKTLLFFPLCFFLTLAASSQPQADSAFYKNEKSLWLSGKTGYWNVVMSLQPAINMKPITIKNIEAVRTMVGAFCLHEVMRPAKGANMPDFLRYADLDYNYNDSRWDYMSIDTRITGGIMFFTNMPDVKDSIVSFMFNTTHPGFGPDQTDRGKSLRVRNVIITFDDNHDVVRQYWKLPDGNEWLAVVYDYMRRK
jgi:hypothetical protein